MSSMAQLIKGMTITLYEKVKTGQDAFRKDIFKEEPVAVPNVLVSSMGADDIISEQQLSGKRAAYELSIPKTDSHVWEDKVVEFFGSKWKTFGFCQKLMTENTPLDWDRKIKVERYG